MVITKLRLNTVTNLADSISCEPDCNTGSWECDPDYCQPECSEICGPDLEGCDPLDPTYLD